MGSNQQEDGQAELGQDEPAEGVLKPAALGRLIDQLPVSTWVCNADGGVVYCNDETRRFGIGDDTGVNLERFSPGYQTIVRPLLDECFRTGKPQTHEGWVLSDVRGRGYWHVHCVPLPDGLVACMIADRTVRKQAEHLADQSEQRYRQLVTGMAEGVAINDRHGVFLFANPACEYLFGVEQGQLVGRNVAEFIAGEDVARFDSERSRRRLGETSSYDLRIRDAQGGIRHVWVTSSPRYDEDRNFDGSHALFLDLEQLKRTERELQERKEQFSTLIETMSDGVMIADEDWRLTFANTAAATLLGEDTADLLGRSFTEFVGEESIAELTDSVSAVASVASSIRCELRLRTPDGREPVVNAWISAQYSEDQLSGRFIVLQDVTEARRGEYIQQLLLRIADSGGVSRSVEELISCIHEEVSKLIPAPNFFVALYDEESGLYHFPYYVDERDHDFGPQALTNSITDYVRRTGEPLLADEDWVRQRIEEGVIGPYGPRAPTWLGVPLKTMRGTIGVVAIQDYTGSSPYAKRDLGILSYVSGYIAMAIERKRAEEVLRHSEITVRLLIDGMLEGMSTTDAAGMFEFANPALEAIFGVESGGLYNKHIDEFLTEDQRSIERQQHELRLRGESGSYELQITRPDRETRDILLSATPRFGSRGQVIGTSGMIQDITQRKQAEAERERLWSQMVHAQKMESLGRLASGISHDFNNILLAVLGNTELSRIELPADSPVQRNLTEVVNAVKRGKALVQQVLALGRRTEPRQEPVSVLSVVEEVIGLMRAGVPANIEIRRQQTATRDTILADPAQLHQVLMNLCTNAIQAMEGSTGVLGVTVGVAKLDYDQLADAPDVEPGDFVVIAISDTGPGMAPEVKRQIFEPFFTTKQPGFGTGLGLAVVQGIVSSGGGVISVQSEPGQGTTFSVFFPLVADQAVSPAPAQESGSQLDGRVLFVDDDEAPLKVGTRMLERLGCEVVAATSGEQALKLLEAEPDSFGVLITDLTMPGMSGLELTAAVKTIRPELPVVLCTGLDASLEVEQAVQRGDCQCLNKPYGLKDLEGMLASSLDDGSDGEEG